MLSGSTSRRRGEADRKLTEEALLGRLDGSLEVECRLLCDDLGREERCVRLSGVARRGLRGIEIGRLSGASRCRWERDRERREGCCGCGGVSPGVGG